MKIKFNNLTAYLKKGGGIHIKESTKGSFTKYCKGKVTQECIDKAKKSGNKKLIKKAVFAENSRKWAKKHQIGGVMSQQLNPYMNQSMYGLQMIPQVAQQMGSQIMPMQQYSSMPSMYPQQGTVTNTQPNMVQNMVQTAQSNVMDLYKQSLTLADDALKAYNSKEDAKKKRLTLLHEQRLAKASSIGNQVGKMAGNALGTTMNHFFENDYNKAFGPKDPVVQNTERMLDNANAKANAMDKKIFSKSKEELGIINTDNMLKNMELPPLPTLSTTPQNVDKSTAPIVDPKAVTGSTQPVETKAVTTPTNQNTTLTQTGNVKSGQVTVGGGQQDALLQAELKALERHKQARAQINQETELTMGFEDEDEYEDDSQVIDSNNPVITRDPVNLGIVQNAERLYGKGNYQVIYTPGSYVQIKPL